MAAFKLPIMHLGQLIYDHAFGFPQLDQAHNAFEMNPQQVLVFYLFAGY